MQFGSSNNAVFFKMRVAGVLHIFQFETKQVVFNSVYICLEMYPVGRIVSFDFLDNPATVFYFIWMDKWHALIFFVFPTFNYSQKQV